MVIAKHFYGTYLNLSFCWTSIDLLFCLSGLLITGILIETKDSPKYYKNFYIRRALRIFPLYYLIVFLFLFYIFYVTNSRESLNYFIENISYFLLYSQNWYFVIHGIPNGGHLNHTWSLAVDEQIYILWPLLIFICKNKNQLIRLCIFTFLFSLTFRIWYINSYLSSNPINPYPYFHNTFCRIDSFAAGSLLYCLLRFNEKILTNKNAFLLFISSGFLIILFGIFDNSFEFMGYYMSNFGFSVVGLFFFTLLYFSLTSNNKFLHLLLQNFVLTYIGKISYSLYVFHWFILILLLPSINNFLRNSLHNSNELLAITLCLIITFLISAFSYRFFEMPIIKLKKKFV